MHHCFDDIAFLEELDAIDDSFGDGDLLEGLRVHEVQAHLMSRHIPLRKSAVVAI